MKMEKNESCKECCSFGGSGKLLDVIEQQQKLNPFGFGQKNSPLAKQLTKSNSFGFGRNDSYLLQGRQLTKSFSFGSDKSDSEISEHEVPICCTLGMGDGTIPAGIFGKVQDHEGMLVNESELDNHHMSAPDIVNEDEVVGSHPKKRCREEERIRNVSAESLVFSPTRVVLWKSDICPKPEIDSKATFYDETGIGQPKIATSLLTNTRLPAEVKLVDSLSHSDSYESAVHALYQAVSSFTHNFDKLVGAQEQMTAITVESAKDQMLESLRTTVTNLENKLREARTENLKMKEELERLTSNLAVV